MVGKHGEKVTISKGVPFPPHDFVPHDLTLVHCECVLPWKEEGGRREEGGTIVWVNIERKQRGESVMGLV